MYSIYSISAGNQTWQCKIPHSERIFPGIGQLQCLVTEGYEFDLWVQDGAPQL